MLGPHFFTFRNFLKIFVVRVVVQMGLRSVVYQQIPKSSYGLLGPQTIRQNRCHVKYFASLLGFLGSILLNGIERVCRFHSDQIIDMPITKCGRLSVCQTTENYFLGCSIRNEKVIVDVRNLIAYFACVKRERRTPKLSGHFQKVSSRKI